MKNHTSEDPGVTSLSSSQIFQDYAEAFTSGTGLPLNIVSPEMLRTARYEDAQQNPFCVLLAKKNNSCAACYKVQCALEEEAQLEAKTMKCFAGMCETAVPLREGGKVIAFLRTGQVLLHTPDRTKFNKIAQQLIDWGSLVDLKRVEEAFFGTRVFTEAKYEALIRLLSIFARHLAASANALKLAETQSDSAAVGQAKSHIQTHVGDDLSLGTVAKVVNTSASHFSYKFKQATGINFSEYVSLTRVEKARNLLENPNLRVSEIAFAVGFQSLSQFNRTFKRVTGQVPGSYRRSLAR